MLAGIATVALPNEATIAQIPVQRKSGFFALRLRPADEAISAIIASGTNLRVCLINGPTVFTKRCGKLVSDQW